MELINQHTKKIMEGCKDRAREAGLRFQDETLEYIVTNRDLLELSPKNMIPTLYDYWVQDIEVAREKRLYELYPHNPYETVINTRPAISFYNDNNPDWLNVMIFYHVLAHIDFFQNNHFFRHTWHEDFAGQALSDKRTLAMLRSEKGHWVDYVIEFGLGIDNLVGFYPTLCDTTPVSNGVDSPRLNFYFDVFLQTLQKEPTHVYLQEIERYNQALAQYGTSAESVFLGDLAKKYPEFEALYQKHRAVKDTRGKDIFGFLQEHSPFLNREENRWMKMVLEIVRNTSIYFQPQIRTKILNEGWASYWHDTLFMNDSRIGGHEVDYARVNAKVTAMPRVGLNPYALGMRLLTHLKESGDKGRISMNYRRLAGIRERDDFDRRTEAGASFLFGVRENLNDFLFINSHIDQDFVDRYQLFVAGKRLNEQKGVWEYFVQSRKAEDYRNMLLDTLYHPPHIYVDPEKTNERHLYLRHAFEGKPLVEEFIPNTMMGLEYLWGAPVTLDTHELQPESDSSDTAAPSPRRVVYTMESRKISKVEW